LRQLPRLRGGLFAEVDAIKPGTARRTRTTDVVDASVAALAIRRQATSSPPSSDILRLLSAAPKRGIIDV
jgi:hypothetical protein